MGCLPLLVDSVLDLCHLPVDKVLIGRLVGEQGYEDLARVVVSVLRNKLLSPRGLINIREPHSIERQAVNLPIVETLARRALGQL